MLRTLGGLSYKSMLWNSVAMAPPADGGGTPGAGETIELKDLAKQLKDVGVELKKSNEETKKVADTALTEVKNLGKITEETKKTFDESFTKVNGLVARVTDIEQKMARAPGAPEAPQLKSLGDLVLESEQWKKASPTSSWKGHVSVPIERKNITSATSTVGTVTSPSNSLIVSDRQPGIVAPPERRLVVRDLLAPGQTNSNMIEYAQETGFTNNARVQSEGAAKAKSDLTFELKTAPVRTIAHYFKASRQILDDAPALRSYIDARARYGLRYAEEAEILAGDGTGQHLTGLITLATAYSAAFVPDLPQAIDKLRLAMLQCMIAEFPPTGIVLHPTDWARIQLLKNTLGNYLIGNPADGNTPRLWNLPVVESLSMSVDKFLVGAFSLAAQIFDRMGIEILLSTENEDDFIKNMVTIRAEERLAMAVYRPEAIIYGDLGYVT